MLFGIVKKGSLNQVFAGALEHAYFLAQLIVFIGKRIAWATLCRPMRPRELKPKISLFLFQECEAPTAQPINMHSITPVSGSSPAFTLVYLAYPKPVDKCAAGLCQRQVKLVT